MIFEENEWVFNFINEYICYIEGYCLQIKISWKLFYLQICVQYVKTLSTLIIYKKNCEAFTEDFQWTERKIFLVNRKNFKLYVKKHVRFQERPTVILGIDEEIDENSRQLEDSKLYLKCPEMHPVRPLVTGILLWISQIWQ